MEKKEFEDLFLACCEIGESFSEGLVFIGGIAVYLHAINNPLTKEYAEFTHDADFYISLADMADLRDIEEVVANRLQNKHQLIKRGFDFDIYTERQSALIVPYEHVLSRSVKYDKLKTACLEHLLVLKLEAYRDRFASTKGEKDALDIIRLFLVSSSTKKGLDSNIYNSFASDEHTELLKKLQRSPFFLTMAKGNSKTAKDLRGKFERVLRSLIGN